MRNLLAISTAAIAAAAALLVACANLPDLEKSDCGDGIVERGEDCEPEGTQLGSASDKPTHCARLGEANACRYVKTKAEEACPAGWGTGTDTVCRRASGLFESGKGGASVVGAGGLQTADFNGDGLTDLVAEQSVDATILLSLGGAAFTSGQRIPLSVTPPFLRKRDPDGAADIFLPRGFLSAWRGIPGENELRPTIFPFANLPKDTKVLPLVGRGFWEGSPLSLPAAKDALLLIEQTVFNQSVLYLAVSPPLPGHQELSILYTMPGKSLAQIANGPDGVPLARTAEVDATNDCDELVLVMTTGAVEVHAPCKGTGVTRKPNNEKGEAISITDFSKPGFLAQLAKTVEKVTYPTIPPPTGLVGKPTALLVADVGTVPDPIFDLRPEILLLTEEETGGAKESALFFASEAQLDGVFGTFAKLSNLAKMPLAVGASTADASADFILADGVILTTVGGADSVGIPATVTGGPVWTEAAFVNFDAATSARPSDVVAAAPGRLDVIRTTSEDGRLYSRLSFPISGTPRDLLVADFDGDRTRDILFRVHETGELFVAYGRHENFPEAPVSIGRVATDGTLSVGAQRAILPDSLEDIFFASKDGRSLSMLLGAPDRALESPLILQTPRPTDTEVFSGLNVLSGVAGRFFGKTDDVTVLSFNTARAGAALTGRFSFQSLALGAEGELVIEDDGSQRTIPGEPMGSFEATADDAPCSDFLYQGARMIAVDLNRDETDEIVMVTPGGECVRPKASKRVVAPAAIHVASKGTGADGKPRWQKPASTSRDSAVANGLTHLWRGDFDGDGFDDVLHLYAVANGTALDMYINTGAVTLTLAHPETQPIEPVIDAVPMQLDDDPAQELVVATAGGIFRLDWTANGWGPRVPLELAPKSTGGNLAAGDFDGDGVADLAVRRPNGQVTLYAGKAVLR